MKPSQETKGFTAAISRRKFLIGSTFAGAALIGDGFLRQTTALEIKKTELTLPKMPKGKEFKIAHLSDLHLHSFNSYFASVVEQTNALEPDMIVLTGDYVEEARNLSGVLEFLEQLRAPAGIFAVQGNWEYWALIEGRSLQRKFAAKGVELLINQTADIAWQGLPISILGIDFPAPSGEVRGLVEKASAERINIALSHVPGFQHELLEEKVDLLLCGHTHGGQIRIPSIKPFHFPRYSGEFVDGLYHVGNNRMPLYVSRGIGTSIIPLRLFCPPEINLTTLRGS